MPSNRMYGTKNGNRGHVAVYMFLIVIIWGCTATVEAVTLRSLSPLLFTFWSTVCGSLGVLVYSLFSGTGKKLLSYGLSEHGKLFFLAVLGFAGYFILKYTAYTTSPIPQANVLQYTFTIFIVLFAVPLLKQPLTVSKLIGVLVGFTGVAVIMTGGTFTSFNGVYLSGYLFALAAGVSFALFSVLFEKSSLERFHALFYFHAYSALILLIILIIQGNFTVPPGLKEISGAFYSGFISNVAGMYFWLSVQNACNDVSLLTGTLYFVPFVSLICFRVFLDLPIPLYAYTGLVLIVGGMAIHTLRSRFSSKNSVTGFSVE